MPSGRTLFLVAVFVGLLFARGVEAKTLEHLAQVSELGYSASTLSHVQPHAEYWIELPGNWLLEKGSYFELVYSVPPSSANGRKQVEGWLSIEVNGKEAQRVLLSEQTVSFERLQVPIAPSRPTPQGLHVVVRFHPRRGGDHCAPPDERTVVVRALSSYRVKYSLRPADEALSALPYPFSWPRARLPIATTFVLADHPSNAERNAAARVAEWLGTHSENSPLRVSWRTVAQVAESGLPEGNGIFLGLSDATFSNLAAPLKCSYPPRSPSSQASLHTCRSPDARHHALLWILGGTEQGLRNAVKVLVEGKIVSAGRQQLLSQKVPEEFPEQTNLWNQSKRTLQSFGQGDLMIRGRGTHTRSLYLRRPRGWQLGSTSKLVLHTTTSEYGEKALRVRINGQQMGFFSTRQLQEEYQTVRLPTGSRSNRTSDGRPADYLVIELEIDHRTAQQETEDCDPLAPEPWTILHQDSVVEFHPNVPDLPDLFWFPYPFERPRENVPTQIVLAPGAGAQYRDAALQVSAELARVAVGDPPSIQIVSTNTADKLGLVHSVLLGTQVAREWAGEVKPDLELILERPLPPEDKALEPVIGQILIASHPANSTSQILVLEADEPHLPSVARALHAADLDGTRLLVTESLDGIVVAESKLGLWRKFVDAIFYIGESARLDALHWLLLLANVFLIKAWRNAVKAPGSKRKVSQRNATS